MAELSIGQLAARADVNASTLRYYESVGLLPSPERKNGQRRYVEKFLDRINFIKVAQQTGFSILEITVLLEGFEPGDSLSERWELMAKQKRSELEEKKQQINSMIQILDDGLSCKCLTWSECLRRYKITVSIRRGISHAVCNMYDWIGASFYYFFKIPKNCFQGPTSALYLSAMTRTI